LNHTPQRGTNEGNAADDALMVDQGSLCVLTCSCGKSNKLISHASMNLRRRFADGIEYPENEEKTKCQEETEQGEPEGGRETHGYDS